MCTTKLQREMQRGITKAKAMKNAELATAIARMAKRIYNDIDIDTKGSINLDLPPKSDEAQINDSSVDFFNHKVMRIFSDLISDRDSTEAIPAYFSIGASRISNMNFTGTRKMMMACGMARLQGCPFCTYALNNCMTRLLVLPHLSLQEPGSRYMEPPLRHCPGLQVYTS